MKQGAIGIFDSGIGGLTVLNEIEKCLPEENYIYLGDTKHFPYGEKTEKQIKKLALNNTKTLVEKGCKIIVVACGTATSQAIDLLQKTFSVPIIGIIEPTIDYIAQKKYKKVGVIATKGTIRSMAWEKELKNKNSNMLVFSQACPMLAEIAEEGKAKSKQGKQAIKEYMKIFKKEHIKHLILGCTHYPIYEDLIKEELEYPVELIHTGKTVAHKVKEILEKKDLKNNKQTIKKIYLTKPSKKFKEISYNMFNIDINIEKI